jgi:hypothetical protein
MPTTFTAASWDDVNALRDGLMIRRSETSAEDVAQAFAELLFAAHDTAVLVRTFLVLPFEDLPERERDFATRLVAGDPRLGARTPVLTLLGSAGREPAWNGRLGSRGHVAIPLLDRAFVHDVPMVAKLLSDLDANLVGLDDGTLLASRKMLGGANGAFYVADASTTLDAIGRHVIPARDFVAAHQVRSVFGMGGAYADGKMAIAVVFTSETIDRLVVDRYPSLISNFKMVTAQLVRAGQVFRA